MSILEALAYWLWCRWFGHRMTAWFDANGPADTKARFCVRCFKGQHRIHGDEVWTS